MLWSFTTIEIQFPHTTILIKLKSISSSKIIKHAPIGPYFKLKITYKKKQKKKLLVLFSHDTKSLMSSFPTLIF